MRLIALQLFFLLLQFDDDEIGACFRMTREQRSLLNFIRLRRRFHDGAVQILRRDFQFLERRIPLRARPCLAFTGDPGG